MANLTQNVWRGLNNRDVKTPSGEVVFSVFEGSSYALTAGAQSIELRRFKTNNNNAFTVQFFIHYQLNNIDAANSAAGSITGRFSVRKQTNQEPVISGFQQDALGDFQGAEPTVSLIIDNSTKDIILNANGKNGNNIEWRMITEKIIYGTNPPLEVI